MLTCLSLAAVITGGVFKTAQPSEAAKILANSFVVSNIDFCNALLSDSMLSTINKLQRLLNAAVKLMSWKKQLRSRHFTAALIVYFRENHL